LGAGVLGHPALAIAWLANKLSQFGLRLEPGSLVMSGSFTRQYDIHRGDAVEARFESIGAVSATFV
jgi:2-oxo-hept-3-ene-1,7-dioate hydratase